MNRATFDTIVLALNKQSVHCQSEGDLEGSKEIDRAITIFAGEVEREEEGKPNPGLRGWTKRKKFDGGIADRAANAEWVQRMRDKT